MRLEVCFTVESLAGVDLSGATVVAVDVLRATSCMVEALASGASGIYPTGSTEEAIKLLQSIGRDDTLLCGERNGLPIEGYHLGNSPTEFTVRSRDWIACTANSAAAWFSMSNLSSFWPPRTVNRASKVWPRGVASCALTVQYSRG